MLGGTVKVNPCSAMHYSINPSSIPTTATSPYANFTVTGLKVGTAYTQVSGSSAYGSHASWFSADPWVKIIITQ